MEELIPQMNGEYTHYKKVVYRLTGYTVDEGKNATYPTFKRHSSESSIHETLEDAKQRLLHIMVAPCSNSSSPSTKTAHFVDGILKFPIPSMKMAKNMDGRFKLNCAPKVGHKSNRHERFKVSN